MEALAVAAARGATSTGRLSNGRTVLAGRQAVPARGSGAADHAAGAEQSAGRQRLLRRWGSGLDVLRRCFAFDHAWLWEPCVQLPGDKPDGVALNNTMLVAPPGGTLTATSMIDQGASVAGATAGWTEIRWYDALNTLLKTDKGNAVDSGSRGAWHASTVTSTAPASAAYAKAAIHLTSVADHDHEIFGDNLVITGAIAGLPEGLVYKAVQTESGTSGSSEPAWPGILGQQVVDNEVIWEAVTTSRVTWTAAPRYVSGATEPVWPTEIGAMVQDGTINWKAISRRVEDEKCPNSKVVAIVASKVFAADKDIVRFSATANPLDWSTVDDAGYLPTGLQQANANNMAVLQQYRANLVALNASSFQNWQVDPDPASMAILDQMDGIGSQWQKAAAPVSNDLIYLSQRGVRTIGIANAAENLAAGDIGAPIDVLVQQAMLYAEANDTRLLARTIRVLASTGLPSQLPAAGAGRLRQAAGRWLRRCDRLHVCDRRWLATIQRRNFRRRAAGRPEHDSPRPGDWRARQGRRCRGRSAPPMRSATRPNCRSRALAPRVSSNTSRAGLIRSSFRRMASLPWRSLTAPDSRRAMRTRTRSLLLRWSPVVNCGRCSSPSISPWKPSASALPLPVARWSSR
ncbi:hypothetical protein SNK04_014382 [Fusarium graminearum]